MAENLRTRLNPKSVLIVGVVISIVALLIGVVGFLAYVETVDEGKVGVVKEKGAATGEVWEPGWHFYSVPGGLFTESVAEINVRPQTYTMSGDVHEGDVDEEDAVSFHSADEQLVGVDVTVRYEVKSNEADQFYIEYKNQDQFEKRLLRPTTMTTVQEEASSFDAVEAKSQEGREELRQVLLEELRRQSPDSVEIQAVQVRDMHLDEEYQRQLEQVEIASQEAEAARRRAQGEADAERIRAQGDADAFEIRNEQLTEDILRLEKIQAYDEGTVFVVDPTTSSIIQADSSSDGNDAASDLVDGEWGDDAEEEEKEDSDSGSDSNDSGSNDG